MSTTSRLTTIAAAGGASSLEYPALIIIYGNSGAAVYDPEADTDVTSTYMSSPSLVATAGGGERLTLSPNQTYLGFGSWARSPALKGATADRTTTPWTQYSNYTGFSIPGTGNDSVKMLAPRNDGLRVAGQSGNGDDEGVMSLTSPSTEYTGQPSQFTSISASSTFFVTDGYLWIISGSNLLCFGWSSNTLSYQSSTSLVSVPAQQYIGLTTGHTKVGYTSSTGYAAVYDVTTTTPTLSYSYNLGYSSSVQSSKLSPDGRYILMMRNVAPYISVLDTTDNSVTAMTVPSGWTNSRGDISWFPDSDGFVVVKTSANNAWIGSFSSGGYLNMLNGGSNPMGYNVQCLYNL